MSRFRGPPDLKLHVSRDYDLDEIFRYINPVMLYTRHLGFKNFEQALAAGDPKALELREAVEAVEEVMLARARHQRPARLTNFSRATPTATHA